MDRPNLQGLIIKINHTRPVTYVTGLFLIFLFFNSSLFAQYYLSNLLSEQFLTPVPKYQLRNDTNHNLYISGNFNFNLLYSDKTISQNEKPLINTEIKRTYADLGIEHHIRSWIMITRFSYYNDTRHYRVNNFDLSLDSDKDAFSFYFQSSCEYKIFSILCSLNFGSQDTESQSQKGFRSKLRAHLNSPVFDYALGLKIKPLLFSPTIYIKNSTLCFADLLLQNSNSASLRALTLNVASNSFGASMETRLQKNELKFSAEFLHLNGDSTTIIPYNLPIVIDGKGLALNGEFQARGTRHRPALHISLLYYTFDINSFDKTSSYAHLDSNVFLGLHGSYAFNLHRKWSTSIFLEHLSFDADKGMIEVYPFTSWNIIINIPDRYKIDNFLAAVSQVGFATKKEFVLGRHHTVLFDGSLSFCNILMKLETRELVRYLGLIPEYVNANHLSIDKNYLLGDVTLGYGVNFKSTRLSVKARQLLPYEIKKASRTKASTGISSNERKTFGGFRIETWFETGVF